ncbi:MAG: ABC transporter ATP-binding protein [Desulfobacterales bacterium]|nr:ABC transporter ATP-binding protein [Desulfobacterales bacterium]
MRLSVSNDIVLNNISFAYASAKPILEDVNLIIKHGEFASIVGPNGSGKTTLLKLFLGLIKPNTGEILVFGDTPENSRLKIGYMPQYAHLDMQFPVTVMDVVLMGRLGLNRGSRFFKNDRIAAMSALEEVKMTDFAKHLFNELSGGQRQRVLIARALCCEPELLLLDEPMSNIDPEIEEALFEILQELNKRMTILLVSHDLGFVSQKVNSVICVNRCVVVHPTSEINGTIIKDIYGGDICMIRHDHRCGEEGHQHD